MAAAKNKPTAAANPSDVIVELVEKRSLLLELARFGRRRTSRPGRGKR